MQTYTIGDTISVELDLQDQSGILTVSASFFEAKSGNLLSMHGEGEDHHEVTVVHSEEVTENTLPGEYRCKDVTVYDTHYNRSTFKPDIRFRVEDSPGDHEGLKLVGWRVGK